MLPALILSLALAGFNAPPASEQIQPQTPANVGYAVQTDSSAAYKFPELTGRVVDQADLLTPEEESELSAMLEGLEDRTKHQFVIVTVISLYGHEIEDYGTRLANHWGIGRKGISDGVLLTVAPNERKVRIDVGYGLEKVLTDAEAAKIIANSIIPGFKKGDFASGIDKGANAIIAELEASQ